MALCVGRAVEGGTTTPSDSSSEEPWVVLNSQLPQGVSFDPDTGTLKGTPERAEPGSLTARHGEPGSQEVSLDLQVLANGSCASIETTEFNWCSGVSKTEQLVASAEGPFEWLIQSPIPGLSQQDDKLSGRIEAPGTYELHVELHALGRLMDVQNVVLNVSDCSDPAFAPPGAAPLQIVTPAALPDACEAGAYAAAFEATGGTPPYRWSIETTPLGLALDEAEGKLIGTPRESGDFQLVVSVDDSAGNHDTFTAVLHIGNATEGCRVPDGDTETGEDDTCGVGDNPPCERPPLEIVTTDLGVACAGVNFAAQIEATGGGGDYTWALSNPARYPAPSGLVLEPTGQLHGIPDAAAIGKRNIGVYVMSTLTDTPSYATVKLEIADCDGLVFITEEPSSDRLFRVGAGTASSTELSEGLLAAGENVHSFDFSADGAHLAFDVRGEGGASRLYWVDLTARDVRQPTFAGELPAGASLIDYRWSLDGRNLAATFSADNGDVFLGVSPADGSTGSSIDIGARYVSGLFWAGERICYVAPGLSTPFLGVLCHAMAEEGVQDQAPLSGIFDPTAFFREDLILSGDEGYLAIFSDETHAEYLLPDNRATSIQHNNRVFSRSLRWAAGLSTESAVGEVVTSQGTPDDVTVLATLDPCDGIDAWSLDERSIACRIGDELAVHQLDADGKLARSFRVEESAGYAGEEFRRLWAPQGQWYAYAAGGNLRVVPIDAAPRSRLIVEGGARSSYAGLSTDARGSRIFYHHGPQLDVIDTAADFSVRKVNGDVLLPDPAACLEPYLEEGPRLWCGAASTPAFVFPAPGAPRVAFVDRQNQLYVADVAAPSAGGEFSAPRLVSATSVKCTMDSGETQCDNFVKWVPRASQ